MAASRRAFLSLLASIPLGGAARTTSAQGQATRSPPSLVPRPGEWRYLNNDLLGTRYSPLDQINKDNFNGLKIAWRWKAEIGPAPPSLGGTAQGNGDPTLAIYRSQSAPIMVDGVCYMSAGGQRVVAAVDAVTGRQLWMWTGMEEHGRDRKAPRRNAGRGVSYWTDGRDERIFVITTGFYLVALDANTGVPVRSFGNNGAVDLMEELNVDFDHVSRIGNSSPPTIFKDTVIIPPAGEEGFHPPTMRNTPGYVMAFDARTGKQTWVFHTVPKPGQFGADTWENGANEYTGNTGVWAPISVDPELGYAYLPVESATNDYYGGHRLGSTLFANSIVCVDIATGKRVWHYQLTHHDIWNYDLPCVPTLVDITVDGKPVKALVQLTKQGFAYVLDRVTGEPVWPFEERPVPASDVPGERAWPTQPHPTRPPAYERQGFVEDDLIDFTPELRAAAIKIASQYRLGPLFTPPSEVKPNGTKGTWYNPGGTGGSLWQGGGFDPETGYFYIPTKTGPGIIAVANDPKSDMRYSRGRGSVRLSVDGLPIMKPPYSRIVAVDLNKGDIAWAMPLGTTPRSVAEHPALKGRNLPNTGGINLHANMLVTKTLLIAGEGWGGAPVVRAYDKKTGAIVGELTIPGMMGSMPMTYMVDGKQYLAFTVGTPKQPSEVVALALDA
ncbi:MAG: PQQ-binding-like beta-propeller repeat protein [Xanthobacteraceae bacterium]|nr:PQQ-binding-like beta-propeller repeat protein [Xanthobacteraceae bacterium]